jgi:hypothetical protein
VAKPHVHLILNAERPVCFRPTVEHQFGLGKQLAPVMTDFVWFMLAPDSSHGAATATAVEEVWLPEQLCQWRRSTLGGRHFWAFQATNPLAYAKVS